MSRSSLPSLLAQVLLLLVAVESCSATITAWWVSGPQTSGPQFIRSSPSGVLTYSMCNVNNTPIFPDNPPLQLPVVSQPKNNTALSGQGWWDSTTTWVSSPVSDQLVSAGIES